MIKAIGFDEFINNDIIYIENINKGFEKYESAVLKGTEEEFNQFIKEVFELNGEENSYFDFYYSRLDDEAKNKFNENLSQNEKELFNKIEIRGNDIYYRLEREIIPFISAINGKNLLFSTLYFSKIPCSLWGNYNFNYPIFFKDKEEKLLYNKLAEKCGLQIFENGDKK